MKRARGTPARCAASSTSWPSASVRRMFRTYDRGSSTGGRPCFLCVFTALTLGVSFYQNEVSIKYRATPKGVTVNDTTFYVLVPVLGKPGEYISVFADGSQGPATRLQLFKKGLAWRRRRGPARSNVMPLRFLAGGRSLERRPNRRSRPSRQPNRAPSTSWCLPYWSQERTSQSLRTGAWRRPHPSSSSGPASRNRWRLGPFLGPPASR